MVEVVHAGNAGCFSVAGKTDRAVRAGLAGLFSISESHTALVNELPVDEDYVLLEGDVLEFFGEGRKGLGVCLTPSELMEKWDISDDEYQHLLEEGLPAERLPSGKAMPGFAGLR